MTNQGDDWDRIQRELQEKADPKYRDIPIEVQEDPEPTGPLSRKAFETGNPDVKEGWTPEQRKLVIETVAKTRGKELLALLEEKLGDTSLRDRLYALAEQVELENQRMESGSFQYKARRLVTEHFNNIVDRTDDFKLSIADTYVVWFSKTLQNWKALVSTTVPDGMYYEVTYNGEKAETYIDAYKKIVNVRIPDEPESA